MEQITIEKHDGTRFDFNRDSVLVAVGKAGRFVGTVKAAVVLLFHRPQYAGLMRTRNQPQAAVFDGRVVHSDPAADK